MDLLTQLELFFPVIGFWGEKILAGETVMAVVPRKSLNDGIFIQNKKRSAAAFEWLLLLSFFPLGCEAIIDFWVVCLLVAFFSF